MKLYFDIGNTNIKLNFVNKNYNNYISIATNFPHTVDSIYEQIPILVKKALVTKIFICSVVPTLTPIFEGLAKKYFKVKPWVVRQPMKAGVNFQIDDPKTLGSDLVALSAYANHLSNNTIIINLGTATTIIHVQNKILNGVIIMPGLKLQLNAILKGAAKIADVEIGYKDIQIGKNTKDALSVGIINSHIYAIKNHIANIDRNAKVIISGGNAKLISNQLSYEYVKEATIEGIKIVEQLNEK